MFKFIHVTRTQKMLLPLWVLAVLIGARNAYAQTSNEQCNLLLLYANATMSAQCTGLNYSPTSTGLAVCELPTIASDPAGLDVHLTFNAKRSRPQPSAGLHITVVGEGIPRTKTDLDYNLSATLQAHLEIASGQPGTVGGVALQPYLNNVNSNVSVTDKSEFKDACVGAFARLVMDRSQQHQFIKACKHFCP